MRTQEVEVIDRAGFGESEEVEDPLNRDVELHQDRRLFLAVERKGGFSKLFRLSISFAETSATFLPGCYQSCCSVRLFMLWWDFGWNYPLFLCTATQRYHVDKLWQLRVLSNTNKAIKASTHEDHGWCAQINESNFFEGCFEVWWSLFLRSCLPEYLCSQKI